MKTLVMLISFLFVAGLGIACDMPNRYDHHNSDAQYNQYYNSVTGHQTASQPQAPVFTARQCWDTCMSHAECKACRQIELREKQTRNDYVDNVVRGTETTRDIIEGGTGAIRSTTRMLENIDRLTDVINR